MERQVVKDPEEDKGGAGFDCVEEDLHSAMVFNACH